MPRIQVPLEQYFEYCVIRNFIREYRRNDGVMSLEFMIPVVWQAIFYPGEYTTGNRRPRRTTKNDALPRVLSARLVVLGFFCTQGGRPATGTERRYILIPHERDITVDSYRIEILRNISSNIHRLPNHKNFARIIFNNYDHFVSGLGVFSGSTRFRSRTEALDWEESFWEAFYTDSNPPR